MSATGKYIGLRKGTGNTCKPYRSLDFFTFPMPFSAPDWADRMIERCMLLSEDCCFTSRDHIRGYLL